MITSYVEKTKLDTLSNTIELYNQFIFKIRYHDKRLKNMIEPSIKRFFWPQFKYTENNNYTFQIHLLKYPLPSQVLKNFSSKKINLFGGTIHPKLEDYNIGIEFNSPLLTDVDKVILNPKNKTQFIVKDNQIYILNQNIESLKNDLRRVLKQLLIYCFEDKGSFIVHSSAISIGKTGILFVGDKGAGKTTMALNGVKSGAKFLSNDRTVISVQNNRSFLHSWVDPIRIVNRNSTKKTQYYFIDYFKNCKSNINLGYVPLKAVVFPTILKSSKGLELKEIDSNYKEDLLKTHTLTPVDPERPKWLGFSTKYKGMLRDLGCTYYTLKCPYNLVEVGLNKLFSTLKGKGESNG